MIRRLETIDVRILMGWALLFLSVPGWAANAEPAGDASPVPEQQALKVAVREVPPFATKDAEGNWRGLSVDLWESVADRMNLRFEWREVPLTETWPALESREIDVAIAALSITPERVERFEFSHPYFVAGLARAYRADAGNAWVATLRAFVSPEFFSAVGSLALVLLAAGALIWIFERKVNAEQFGHGGALRGLGDGFWWSAVTMTTVGYGDKAPKTLAGRIVGLVWMFLSLIIIASFTASIAASLTANRLADDRTRTEPLDRLQVGVVSGTTAEEFTRDQGARMLTAQTIDDALQLLADERVDVVVHDSPLLRYVTRERFPGIEVSQRILVRDDYGFAYATGSELRRPVNVALLDVLLEPEWEEIRSRYLGSLPE